jgi:hypothetical protein
LGPSSGRVLRFQENWTQADNIMTLPSREGKFGARDFVGRGSGELTEEEGDKSGESQTDGERR